MKYLMTFKVILFQKTFQIIAIVIAMISLYSCASNKTIPKDTMQNIPIPGKDSSVAFDEIDTIQPLQYKDFTPIYQYNYSWITYRCKANYTFKGNEGECNLFYVNRIDSIIYCNINIAGIEIVRLVLTHEKLIYVNKLNKTYYSGDYSFFKSIAGLPVTFDMVQAIMNGKDFKNFDTHFNILEGDNQTVLQTNSRKENSSPLYLVQKITLDKNDQIIENLITIKSILKKISLHYADYNPVDTFSFFNQLRMESADISIQLLLKNTKFNTPGPTSITIPESFSLIEIK